MSAPLGSREQYDQLWSKQWANLHAGGPLARTRYRLALKFLRIGATTTGRMLDVGAGNGAFLNLVGLRAPKLELFGAEFSQNAIDLAPPPVRKRLARCDLQGQEPLPWGGGFDLMSCMEVLEHLKDDALAMRHVAAALAPGGTLLVSVPSWQRKWCASDVAAGHVRRYEPDQLRAVIEGAGLVIDRFRGWGGPLTWGYLQAANRIGPDRVMSISPTGFAGFAANAVYHVVKLDDVLSTLSSGEQWFVTARKPG
jgi:2-polyprenyl-3-methyl-5-hydroxy-6-metoxy-1,4-benzoquinol methylase